MLGLRGVQKGKRVNFGVCQLCRQLGQLRKSHFLPAALWRGARDRTLANPNPVVVTKRASMTTSKQLQQYLLCERCEARFDQNGERYALSWIRPTGIAKKEFPLLDRLNLALEYWSFPGVHVYSGKQIGIETEKFAYFALSILWRASVDAWRFPDGRSSKQAELGSFDLPIRKFLLSEGSFPRGIVVVLTVCTDVESRGTFYPPALRKDGPFPAYGLLTQGVHFDILLADGGSPALQDICCVGSAQKLIFSRDRSVDAFESFSYLAATSRPAANLR
jgi:hypothetical protein